MRQLLSKFSVIREQKNAVEQEQAAEQEHVSSSMNNVASEKPAVTVPPKSVAVHERRTAPPPPTVSSVASKQVVRNQKRVPAPRPSDSLQQRVTSSPEVNFLQHFAFIFLFSMLGTWG